MILLTDFDHLEILFSDAALWAHKIFWHVLPECSWRNIFLLTTLRFIIDIATNNALPLAHGLKVGRDEVRNVSVISSPH